MKLLKNMATSLLIMMSALTFTSCSDNEEIVDVTDIRVEPATLTLVVGEQQTLAVKTLPENATVKVAVSWASNATHIATVNAITGEVTAIAEGTATIIAGIAGAADKTASCTVMVVAPEVPVTGVSVAPAALELLVGAKQTLTATVLPENATCKTVTWTSSAANIAAVDAATGEVTAIAAGTAVITATAPGGKSAACNLTVNPVRVESITVDPVDFELEIDSKRTLTATVLPENATDKTVVWTSSAANIATVDESTGEVTGIAEGTATITATADGKTATCAVTVIPRNDIFLTVKPGSGSEVRIYAAAQHLVVNWGDETGNSEYDNCTEISHTYADGSLTYNVKIMAQGLTAFGDVLYNNNMTGDYVSPKMKGEVSSASFNNCPDLKVLAVTGNKLTGLELKECPALLYLNCITNQITSLDASNVTALEYIFFYSNKLTTINLNGLSALKTLKLYSNLLTSLNVDDCISLKDLDCSDNKLTSLNLNSCKTTLTDLDCGYNELTTLNLSGYSGLQYLTCRDNKLKLLDVTGCTALVRIYSLYNELETINVNGCSSLNFLRTMINQLSAAELNRIFTDLPDRTGLGSGQLYIATNPGTNDCDRTIATSKGWGVY